jgi:hypothetical protein
MNAMLTIRSKQHTRVIFAALFVAFLFPLHTAFAVFMVNVTPAVIDGEGKTRELLRYTATITNNSQQLVSLYPWVRDVMPEGEVLHSPNTDAPASLANWLEFSRSALDIAPGDSVDLPILVQINLRAKPGNYHAVIHFSNGGNRADAEANTSETSSLLLNIRVLEDVNERLSLGTFTPDKNFFPTDNVSFSYHLENTGNRGVVPSGKIRIYDSKGQEVATVDANQDKDKIEPDTKQLIAAAWQSGTEFGRYKAMLDLEYGTRGTIQDTVFFWVLPWKHLLSVFLVLAFVCVFLALLAHSYIASGGKKFAYVTERLVRRPEYGVAREEQEDPPVRKHISHPNTTKSVQATLAVFEPEDRPRAAVEGHTGRVTLTHRPKPKVDPAHIVNLKK